MFRGQDRPPSSGLLLKHNLITQLWTLFYSTNWR